LGDGAGAGDRDDWRLLLQSEQAASVVKISDVEPALRLFVGLLLSAELQGLLGDPAAVRRRFRASLPAVIELFVSAVSAPSRREGGGDG
jgi:hypothetical protein